MSRHKSISSLGIKYFVNAVHQIHCQSVENHTYILQTMFTKVQETDDIHHVHFMLFLGDHDDKIPFNSCQSVLGLYRHTYLQVISQMVQWRSPLSGALTKS